MRTLRYIPYFLLAAASPLLAQVPQMINYQGRVAVGGTNFDGTGLFQFALVGNGGSPVFWSNGASSVSLGVAKGLFSVLLGDTNLAGMTEAIPAAVFTNTDVRLRVWFDGGAGLQSLSPDQRIGTVGYAMMAANVASLNGGQIIGGDLQVERLQVGSGHVLSGDLATIAGGSNNTASGIEAAIGGGHQNVADGTYATVGGGEANVASGPHTFIGGGYANYAYGAFIGAGSYNIAAGGAVIGGGEENVATNGYAAICGGSYCVAGEYAFVGGGYLNRAEGRYASICGGDENTASQWHAFVGGGWDNTASGEYASVGCGWNNIASGRLATIGGGLQNTADGEYNFVGGGQGNATTNSHAAICGGHDNTANGECSIVGGGAGNAATNAYATACGGYYNIVGGYCATVGGGAGNRGPAQYATVGGGYNNIGSGMYATIAGGEINTASGDDATVAGGHGNTASGSHATVAGGLLNVAGGANSFAAGHRAKALNDGAFVWGDHCDADISSTTNNQFTARCSGGVRFFSDTNATAGVELAAGAGAWNTLSDRNAKENLAPVDCGAVLEKVAAMPVTTWNLKTQDPSIRHIGPMAQDFQAAFRVGEDDRHITTSDADGVALAAIKGLCEALQRERARSTALEKRLTALERRFE